MKLQRLLSILILITLAASALPVASARASAPGQSTDPTGQAHQLLLHMTPEERVGQLFLVTFTGSSADKNSQIYDLVVNHHIGGVILRGENDNFVAAPDTIQAAYQLIDALQTAEWQASQNLPPEGPTGTSTPEVTPTPVPTIVPASYVPLFIGVSQAGDGYPDDQILNGLTPLPDLMAIGATWDPTQAEKVGTVAGQELSALGFNLYFGPSLDVLESPDSMLTNGLGATAFGGDPYWVGEMGRAYITGLHSGSNGRMAVIAEHFPGRGNADRPAGGEPATVRKSLESLKQIELAPFFAVTGNAPTALSTVDGLLVSHIRYQGFQGNIRATTRPVSFDATALSQILVLPQFIDWRQSGGLIVSDDLGSQTVRRFYDPGGTSFSARQVALDAFLAGNDLLYMGNIVSSDATDNYTTVVKTLEFFSQKYREDPAFAQRVDAAAERSLTYKYRLYGNFNINSIIPDASGLALLGKSVAVTFGIARQSATLVSPEAQDLVSVLPTPPEARDRIVFITDVRSARQCSTCPDAPVQAMDALQNAVLRLYGPQAGGQVNAGRLISYSLENVSAILAGGSTDSALEGDLRQAQWIIISMLAVEPGQEQTVLLKRFLAERQDLLRDKRVIVFAFNAPYYLDSTDISKLTAYYCLYSKSAPFVDMAARLLFREMTPSGSLPVSVPGIGYDLLSATAPSPDQVISLSLNSMSVPTPTGGTGTETPEPTSTPFFRVGDTITVQTGVIIDHNGHPVPDGTGVRFMLTPSGEGGVVQQVDAVTAEGVAKAAFSIDRSGLLEVRATSDPANTSVVLQLTVSGEGVSVTIVAPTAIIEATSTPAEVATPSPGNISPLSQGYPGFGGWIIMVLLLAGACGLFYWMGNRYFSARWGVRWALCAVAGGLLAYTYLAFRLPGADRFIRAGGLGGIVGVVIVGAAVGAAACYLWLRLTD
jgi:beta-N-acetylhexosaminidase